MPFDWNNYLALAEELATRVDDASKRTAISRAYYCVFNLAFARAELTAGPRPRNESYHRWCWSQYEKTADLQCKQLGVDGSRMRSGEVELTTRPRIFTAWMIKSDGSLRMHARFGKIWQASTPDNP